MYIDVVPNRTSPPAILLRESYRDGNKVRKRTLLNLTSWPRDLVVGFRALLKGGTVIPAGQEALTIIRSQPHGHVAAVLSTLRRSGLDRLLGPDGKKGKLQIVYGLLCAADGCPVAIEVFDGNTADPATLASQISKLKQRFGVSHVVLVGDRGMITQARLSEDVKPAGLDWITALRAPSIKALAEGGALQLSLFDDRDMATITSPDFPGERLIVCRNPDLARERGRKRVDLLAATERNLAQIAAAVGRRRQPLR